MLDRLHATLKELHAEFESTVQVKYWDFLKGILNAKACKIVHNISSVRSPLPAGINVG